jgi:uncharacterized protein YndB with AHSA1/START domain
MKLMSKNSTRVSQHINAPRAKVYRALVDANAISKWKVPTGTGKTTAHTDTYHGRFVKLVPNEQVVEVDEFETADSALCGEMTVTITLTDADGGTDVLGVHEGLPPGLSTADNEAGWRMALTKLAALVEAGGRRTRNIIVRK